MRARLAPDRRTLDRAYKAVRKEKWRRQLAAEWASLDCEGWPSTEPAFAAGSNVSRVTKWTAWTRRCE